MEKRTSSTTSRGDGGTTGPKLEDGKLTELSVYDQINEIAKYDVREPLSSKNLYLHLKHWWCKKFNRPLKDPLLLEYSMEELLYEYYMYYEADIFKEEKIKENNDRIEEEAEQENLDWAEQEEARELEELKRRQEAEDSKKKEEDEANRQWMDKQLREEAERQMKALQEKDPTFGQDIVGSKDE